MICKLFRFCAWKIKHQMAFLDPRFTLEVTAFIMHMIILMILAPYFYRKVGLTELFVVRCTYEPVSHRQT